MPLFNLELNIPKEYKYIINKYIEILAIVIIYIILMDSDPRSSLIDRATYLMLWVTFHTLVVEKLVAIT